MHHTKFSIIIVKGFFLSEDILRQVFKEQCSVIFLFCLLQILMMAYDFLYELAFFTKVNHNELKEIMLHLMNFQCYIIYRKFFKKLVIQEWHTRKYYFHKRSDSSKWLLKSYLAAESSEQFKDLLLYLLYNFTLETNI